MAESHSTVAPLRDPKWLEIALFAFIVLGLASRFILALVSEGSNDFHIWDSFARFIREKGLSETYRYFKGAGTPYPLFNHPPFAGLYAVIARQLADWLGIRFSILLKLPGILSECIAAYLLWRIGANKDTRIARATRAAAFAWAPCSILVSGFHGNTDGVYAALTLLAVYLTEQRRKPFLSGIALAGALNVKLIPSIIVPGLASSFKTIRGVIRFCIGLTLGLTPFLFPMLTVPGEFGRNVFSYTPKTEAWGIMGIAMSAFYTPKFASGARAFYLWYLDNYRPFLLGPAFALGLFQLLTRRWTVSQVSLLCLLTFYILTPGYAVQYSAALCPLAFAVTVSGALIYSVLSGLFILIVYVAYSTGQFPWTSEFTGGYPFPAPLIGMLAWGWTIYLFCKVLCMRNPAVGISDEKSRR